MFDSQGQSELSAHLHKVNGVFIKVGKNGKYNTKLPNVKQTATRLVSRKARIIYEVLVQRQPQGVRFRMNEKFW